VSLRHNTGPLYEEREFLHHLGGQGSLLDQRAADGMMHRGADVGAIKFAKLEKASAN
jgi:hypothetical protein